MIDDAVLERMVRDAGEAVPVPPDGAARVLAARGSPDGSGGASRRRRSVGAVRHLRARPALLVAAAAVLVGAVLAVGVVRGGAGGALSAARATPAGRTPAGRTSAGRPSAAAGALATGAAPQATSASGSSGSVSGAAPGSSGGGVPEQAAPSGGLSAGQTGSAATGTAAGSPTVGLGALAPVPAPQPVPADNAAPPEEVPSLPTKVIETGSASLQVPKGHVPAVMTALTADATGLGGYVASSTSTDSVPGTPATGSLVLRVPVAAFATLVADTRHAGTATSVTTSGQDVTAQYVDLQARIDALTTARKQYEQILAKAETIGDILSVEDELSDVQTQIEQLQGQLDVLEDQATYSTLTVHLTEPAPAPPPPVHHATQSGLTKAWDHARSTFTNGLESVVAALGGIAVFVVTVGTLGALAWGAWVIGRRRLL